MYCRKANKEVCYLINQNTRMREQGKHYQRNIREEFPQVERYDFSIERVQQVSTKIIKRKKHTSRCIFIKINKFKNEITDSFKEKRDGSPMKEQGSD